MYIIVNNDLGMQKGKIASQVGHVVALWVEQMLTSNKALYFKWKSTGQKKIVLKTSQTELEQLMKHSDAKFIIDAGRTQIPEHSLTVVGFLPCYTSADSRFEKYKLL